MTRLPWLDRAELDPKAQAIWDGIAAVRSPTMRGPFGILMHIPELADRVAHLEDYFRFDAELPADDRELVTLATTREVGARYPWARHEIRAREVGVRPEAIDVLRANGDLDGLTPHEQILAEVVRALLRTHAIPADLYARAEAELGRRKLIEVVTLTGHYGTVGLLVGAFEIPAPEEGPHF